MFKHDRNTLKILDLNQNHGSFSQQKVELQQENTMSAIATFFTLPQGANPEASVHLPLKVKLDKHFIKTACSNCNMRELCVPIGLDAQRSFSAQPL